MMQAVVAECCFASTVLNPYDHPTGEEVEAHKGKYWCLTLSQWLPVDAGVQDALTYSEGPLYSSSPLPPKLKPSPLS